jgi:hypothetical protein
VVVGKAPRKPGMAAQLPHVAPSQSGSHRMPTSTMKGTRGLLAAGETCGDSPRLALQPSKAADRRRWATGIRRRRYAVN